jgi:ubiquinone/menaquinone biosynthesis C-methylase UbiE
VTTAKSEKELAFLHDLFISTDWGERFSELIDEHVEIPSEGKALYLAAGTGGHAIAIQERAGDKLLLICVDESEECLELARAKATATNDKTEFHKATLEQLPFPGDHFDLVIGDASLVSRQRVAQIFEEMVRVAALNARVALTLPTASSFGEFFSIYWEALHNTGLVGLESGVEHLITELPTIGEAEQMALDEGLEDVEFWTRIEEFDYESGEHFLNAPLVAHFLMNDWLTSVPEVSRLEVAQEISRLINEERHEGKFALTVKATLVVGRKALSH